MTNESSDDRPWTEEQWEQLFKESDARSAKFGELLETLHGDPNRDEIIAHEMGWDLRDREPSENEVPFDEEDEEFEAAELDGLDSEDDFLEFTRRKEESLEAIPAYSRGYKWGALVRLTLQPHFDDGDDELEPDDPLVEAYSHSLIVAAKVAGGHGMGYDDEVLCGNIVCCKRALQAAERSLQALEELQEQGTLPSESIQPLLVEGREVRHLVEQHIAELRSRVWWQ
jgi:hypothetical protein